MLDAKDFIGRDQLLIKRSIDTLYENIIIRQSKDQQFAFDDYRAVVPSPRTYKGVWNWDSAFHMMAFSRLDPAIGKDQMRILFDYQKEDGQIADVIYSTGKTVFEFTKPPVLAWAIMVNDKISPDLTFLEYAFPHLLSNLKWWEINRYDGTLFGYKVHKMESGWDDTVRFDKPHVIENCYAIDANCFMVTFYDAMIYISEKLGKSSESFKHQRRRLINKINEFLYDSENHYYCDYDQVLHSFTHRLSPASFMPLFVHIANAEQAEAMMQLAKNSEYFYKGIPTISYNQEAYSPRKFWRGPTWLNTSYFTIRGLYDYGFKDLALDLTENMLDWCYKNKRSIREYYHSKTGKGLGAKNFGWSAAFLIEFVLLKNGKLDW